MIQIAACREKKKSGLYLNQQTVYETGIGFLNEFQDLRTTFFLNEEREGTVKENYYECKIKVLCKVKWVKNSRVG